MRSEAPQPAESGAPENLNRAGRYDLHIHSAISDGTQSLTELVPLIARAGLAGFALTITIRRLVGRRRLSWRVSTV